MCHVLLHGTVGCPQVAHCFPPNKTAPILLAAADVQSVLDLVCNTLLVLA